MTVEKGSVEHQQISLVSTKEVKIFYRLVLVSLVLILLSTSSYLILYPVHISCDCGSQQGKIYKIEHPVDNKAVKLQPGGSLVYSGPARTKRDAENLTLDAEEKQCVLADIMTLESFDQEVYQWLSGDSENKDLYAAAAKCMQDHVDKTAAIGTCFNELQKKFEEEGIDDGLKVPQYLSSKMSDDVKPECKSGWEKVLKNAMQAFEFNTRALPPVRVG